MDFFLGVQLHFTIDLRDSICAGINSKNFYLHYTYCTNEKQQIPLSFYPRWGTVGAGTSTRASASPLKNTKKPLISYEISG